MLACARALVLVSACAWQDCGSPPHPEVCASVCASLCSPAWWLARSLLAALGTRKQLQLLLCQLQRRQREAAIVRKVVGRSMVGLPSLLITLTLFGSIVAVCPMPEMTMHVGWFNTRRRSSTCLTFRARVFGPAALEFVKVRTSLRLLYALFDVRRGFLRTGHDWLGELGAAGPMMLVALTRLAILPMIMSIENIGNC